MPLVVVMFSTKFVLTFALLLSMPLLSLLAPRILPPRNLPRIVSIPDELDDLALFRRASLSASNVIIHTASASAAKPPPSDPKIAFLFLTNSGLPFAPLWARFLRGHDALFNAYIHADPAASLLASPPPFRHLLIASKPTRRASPTLISAVRRLLAAALLDDPRNAFFALLSQSCVPLHSFPFLRHTLLNPPALAQAPARSVSYIEILSDQPGLWDRYTARGDPDSTMLPEIPFDQFRVGSQFFILTRTHALAVVRDRRLWHRFRLPCKKTESCYPEEHYFPTLLNMKDSAGCAGYTLTWVNWTGSTGGHPYTYGPTEVSAGLVRLLRKSNHSVPYIFARKFAPASLEPLLALADSVILRD